MNSKFSQLQEPRMPPRSWTSQLRQRKQRPKIFPSFNQARKKTLLLRLGTVAGVDCITFLLRPGTVTSVDCVRLLWSLPTLIKNMQELAKEEGEESEAKLKEAIKILEGATFTTASS